LWINGSPGAGKSAIASSLVSILTRRRKLASYFFFRRNSANLGDPATLWRTVAFDLASYHPILKAHVIEFLSRPGFRDSDILQHFECLIEDGLIENREELSHSHPVIVLDALDECGSDETHDAQRHILLETILSWSRLPRSYKLIITSRNERLPNSFYDKQVCRQITLETGDSVTEEAQNDIRVFFKHRLDEIRPKLGCPSTWPGEQIIDQLTDRAAGLFIWAKTAMEFMKEKHGSPSNRLKLVLAGKLGKKGENIDTLYRNILDFAFADSDEATLELFRMVVGAVIVARAPLPRDDLMYFMYILGRQCEDNNWQINSILENLSSVLKFDSGIHLRHHSFAEFMCDPNRCRQQHFLIDHSDHHCNLARVCLSVMKQELQFNICKLESSHFRNEDVVDLAERLAANISPRLSYSCRFWAAHLCDVTCNNVNNQILLREVGDLFHNRILYWLEVMSLIGEIPSSSMMLLMAARWIEVS
jgi:NACHT domain